VTQHIVGALAVKLTEGEQGRLGRVRTGNPEAYDFALQGRNVLKRTTRETNAEARRLFVKALELDPGLAGAHVGLGWANLQSWQLLWSTDPESLERAQELAQRAIALDDTLSDAYRLLAQVYLCLDRRPPPAPAVPAARRPRPVSQCRAQGRARVTRFPYVRRDSTERSRGFPPRSGLRSRVL
jgi:hypothetical protein